MFRRVMYMVCFNVVLIGFYLADSARGGTVSIEPSLRLGERYDSNPFLRGEELEIESDFITELSPRISLNRVTKNSRVGGFYLLSSNHYNRYSELDNVSHTANLNGTLTVSKKSSLTIGDSFRFTPDSLMATDLGIQTQRTDILSNTVFVSMNRNFSRAFYTGLTIQDTVLDYDDAAFVDTRTDSASLSGNYMWTPDTLVTLAYTYTKYNFVAADGESDIESHSATLALQKQLSPRVSVNLSGGAVYTPDVDENPDWTASADFAKTYAASSVSLGYSRIVTNASGLSDTININETASLAWDYTAGRSFKTNVMGTLSKNRAKPSGILDTTSYSASAGFVWQANSWLAIDARYLHFQQRIEVGGSSSLSRDQVFIGVTATPSEVRF